MMTEMLLPLFRLLRVSLFSHSILNFLLILLGGTKTVVLVEAILEEEKSYPKHVQSEANFYMLSISSSLALEALSS